MLQLIKIGIDILKNFPFISHFKNMEYSMETNDYKISNGSTTTPSGFQACGIQCDIKQQGKDLTLLVSDVPASIAAMFTTNRMFLHL